MFTIIQHLCEKHLYNKKEEYYMSILNLNVLKNPSNNVNDKDNFIEGKNVRIR